MALCIVLAAAMYHQHLIKGIVSFFKQSQSQQLENPAIGRPDPIDPIENVLEKPEVSGKDNSLFIDPNAQETLDMAEAAAPKKCISRDSDLYWSSNRLQGKLN